jgi:hypothetical protein
MGDYNEVKFAYQEFAVRLLHPGFTALAQGILIRNTALYGQVPEHQDKLQNSKLQYRQEENHDLRNL